MEKNEKKLLTINSLYTLGNALSSVFVNVFLYVYTQSLIVMTIYTIIKIGLYPPMYYYAGKLASRKNFGVTLSIGLSVLMLQLIVILYFNSLFAVSDFYVYLTALIAGVGEGFFWLSMCSLNQIVTNGPTRNRYFGLAGIFNNISSIIAPLLATALISHSSTDMEGYIVIFKVVLVIFAFISVLGFSLKFSQNSSDFTLKDKFSLKDRNWRYVAISNLLLGIRDSMTITLAGLLIYNATGGNGSLYSKLLALFALISILSHALIVRQMNNRNRNRFYCVGCILTSSSTLALVLFPNIWGAIYYGLVNAFATPMYAIPSNILSINCIARYTQENLIGRVIGRECFKTMGRCGGMIFILILFFLLKEPLYLPVSVILLSLSPVVLILFHFKEYPQISRN